MTTDLTAEEIAELRKSAASGLSISHADTLRLIDQLSRLKEANRSWTKCSDQMPPIAERVTIMRDMFNSPGTYMDHGYRVDDNYWYYNGAPGKFPNDYVKYWMPMPTPPAPEAAS